MDLLILILGGLLVVIVILDILWTSLWIDAGAGILTRSVGHFCWRAIHLASRGNHRIMNIAGPLILTMTVLAWVAGLWGGWLLIFSADPAWVISASDKSPASLVERIYYTGFTVFTLGVGDFKPASGASQVMTAIASGTGLLAITLAITYLLSVVSAGVAGRTFASKVSSLGPPDQAMARSWDGQSYAPLSWSLQTLSGDLALLGRNYLAYPVLQYYHTASASSSPIVAVARLEQLLTLAQTGVPSGKRPSLLLTASLQASIESLLDTLPEKFTRAASEPLPMPSRAALHAADLPAVSDEAFTEALSGRERPRQRLRHLLEGHGWSVRDASG